MDKPTVVLIAVVVCVLVLMYLQFQQSKQTSAIKTDIEEVYKESSEELVKRIETMNAEFQSQVNAEVQKRLQDAGVSKEQLADLQSQSSSTQVIVQKLQEDVKTAALQHMQTLQGFVDESLSKLQALTDQLAKEQQSDITLALASEGDEQRQALKADFDKYQEQLEAEIQLLNDQSAKFQTDLQGQYQDISAKIRQDSLDESVLLKGDSDSYRAVLKTDSDSYRSVLKSDTDAYRAQLKSDTDGSKSSMETLFEAAKQSLASTVSNYEQALKVSQDGYTAQTIALQNQYIQNIKDQGSQTQTLIAQAMAAFQTNDVPTLINQFTLELQAVINKTSADMEKMLYGYGYRRTYVCSFNMGDMSVQPTNLLGIASIVRKVGTSITIYTCTLPEALPYQYVPLTQVIVNKEEATTYDNDLAVPVAKAIDASTFSIAIERAGGNNDLTMQVTLIEK